MHRLYFTPKYISTCLIALGALTGCSCSSHSDKVDEGANNQDLEWLSTEAFVTPAGMTADRACQLPGLEWELDTLKGACKPDTLIILANYYGNLYPTNLRSIKGKLFDNLKTSGNDKIEKGETSKLDIADFKPNAKILDVPTGSYEKTKALADTTYYAALGTMTDVARKFFLTNGSPELMRRSLAMAWEKECQEAADYGEKVNPFNGGYYAKFIPNTLKAEVADATRGIVEVEVYSADSYTLGYPGTTYWTVAMCIEQGEYKLKELPALHRKFEN